MAVSKATKNVLTATNPNDFIFHSSYNTFKIVAQGIYTNQSVNASTKTFTLTHGLSYTPTFYAFAKFPDGKATVPNSSDYTTKYNVSTGYGNFSLEADATTVYFIFTRNSATYSVDFKYYLFESPL